MAKRKENIEESLEKQLWKAADKLRKNIDAAEYKHVVLGLIFLKYISVSFEELYARLQTEEIKERIQKIEKNIKQKMFSMYLFKHVGVRLSQMQKTLK